MQSYMDTIEDIRKKITKAQHIQELMGYEGNIRKTYYSAWPVIIDQEIEFEKRVKNPPDNMVNTQMCIRDSGLGERKTHYFENVVHVEEDRLLMSEDLKEKIAQGYRAGLLKSKVFLNENEIEEELHPMSVPGFFNALVEDVKTYYGV